jgi:dissimilatory sulfite reductase related protein
MNPSARASTLLFDDDGFLANPEEWSEETAERIAQMDGLGVLNAEQRALLHSLREQYRKHGFPTAWSHICHLNGLDNECLTQIFPSAREAWRLAGLPNPGDEAVSYM